MSGGFEVLAETRRAPREGGAALMAVAVGVGEGAQGLAACLDAIAAQTHPRVELIVVDDAFGDGGALAVPWLQRRPEAFERSLVVRQGRRGGPAASRNLAFALAEAPAVLPLDAADRPYPRALARLSEALTDSGAAFAYAHAVRVGAAGGLDAAGEWRPDELLREDGGGGVALVERAAWGAAGGGSALDCHVGFLDLWCRMVEAGRRGVFVPELLCTRGAPAASPADLDGPARSRLDQLMLDAHPWLALRG